MVYVLPIAGGEFCEMAFEIDELLLLSITGLMTTSSAESDISFGSVNCFFDFKYTFLTFSILSLFSGQS